jgi:hypothetical protein
MRGMVIVALLVAGLMGGALVATPAHAKCASTCKHSIIGDFHSCKLACKSLSDKPSKKACKKACITDKKDALTRCKAAVAPACSASGAFID